MGSHPRPPTSHVRCESSGWSSCRGCRAGAEGHARPTGRRHSDRGPRAQAGRYAYGTTSTAPRQQPHAEPSAHGAARSHGHTHGSALTHASAPGHGHAPHSGHAPPAQGSHALGIRAGPALSVLLGGCLLRRLARRRLLRRLSLGFTRSLCCLTCSLTLSVQLHALAPSLMRGVGTGLRLPRLGCRSRTRTHRTPGRDSGSHRGAAHAHGRAPAPRLRP